MELKVTDPKTGKEVQIQLQEPSFEVLNAAWMAMYSGVSDRVNIAASGRVIIDMCALNKESNDWTIFKGNPAMEITASFVVGERYMKLCNARLEEKKSNTDTTPSDSAQESD